jgi:phosphate transport system substrate-binding protein
MRLSLFAGFMLALAAIFVAPAQGFAEPIRGSGSTFAAPLIERWSGLYRAVRVDGGDFASADWRVDYEAVGSVGGMVRVAAPEMDFAATDAPLPPAELTARGLVQFPFVIGGVAVVVNIDGLPAGQLQLSAALIADIYMGKVSTWADPAIKALNPALALPDLPITVVQRSDGSGTTFTFTQYLSAGSEAWRTQFGANTDIRWPKGVAARGSQAVVTTLQATRGSIGYVEYGQVRRASLPYALVQNRAGRFVRPEATAFQAAAASADWAGTKDFFLSLTEVAAPEAYPITATTFALVPRTRLSRSRLRDTMTFFRIGLTEGGEQALSLGYIPLPPAAVEQVKRYWASELRASF